MNIFKNASILVITIYSTILTCVITSIVKLIIPTRDEKTTFKKMLQTNDNESSWTQNLVTVMQTPTEKMGETELLTVKRALRIYKTTDVHQINIKKYWPFRILDGIKKLLNLIFHLKKCVFGDIWYFMSDISYSYLDKLIDQKRLNGAMLPLTNQEADNVRLIAQTLFTNRWEYIKRLIDSSLPKKGRNKLAPIFVKTTLILILSDTDTKGTNKNDNDILKNYLRKNKEDSIANIFDEFINKKQTDEENGNTVKYEKIHEVSEIKSFHLDQIINKIIKNKKEKRNEEIKNKIFSNLESNNAVKKAAFIGLIPFVLVVVYLGTIAYIEYQVKPDIPIKQLQEKTYNQLTESDEGIKITINHNLKPNDININENKKVINTRQKYTIENGNLDKLEKMIVKTAVIRSAFKIKIEKIQSCLFQIMMYLFVTSILIFYIFIMITEKTFLTFGKGILSLLISYTALFQLVGTAINSGISNADPKNAIFCIGIVSVTVVTLLIKIIIDSYSEKQPID